MKKKQSVQSQIAALAFVLSFVMLNAAEKKVIQKEASLASYQTPIPKLVLSEARLTEAEIFSKVEVISKFAERLEGFHRMKIEDAIKMVHPDRYTDAFVEVFHHLSRSGDVFYNASLIIAVGQIDIKHYADFIRFIDQLWELVGRYLPRKTLEWELDDRYLAPKTLEIVAKISPDLYPKFVEVVRKLLKGDRSIYKSGIIEVVAKISPNDYDSFVDRVNDFVTEIGIQDIMDVQSSVAVSDEEVDLFSMNSQYKYKIISTIGGIPQEHYTDFKYTVSRLAQGVLTFEKISITNTVGRLRPDCYTDDFIQTVKELLEGVDILERGGVIIAAGMVNPNYRANFVNMINQIADETNKSKVIRALAPVSPDLYTPLQNLIKSYFQYFFYVHPDTLQQMIRPNMNQEELEGVIRSLYEKNYRPLPPLFSRGPASISKKLKPVFNHIQASVKGHVLSYERVLELLDKEMEKIRNDRSKSRSSHEFDKVYGWVIQNNSSEYNKDNGSKDNSSEDDKMVIAPVVTYLHERDGDVSIAKWLHTLMKESNEVYYQSLSQTSCMEGLSERVIASLRSAIPENDNFLKNFFREYSKT